MGSEENPIKTEQPQPADEVRGAALSDAARAAFPRPAPGLELPVLPDRDDRFLTILRKMRAWIVEVDAAGHAVYHSPSVEDVLGWPSEEALRPGVVKIHPDDFPGMAEAAKAGRSTGQPTTSRFRLQHKSGHWVWIEASTFGWYPAPDGEYHTASFNRDVTEIIRANDALRESEERYRVVSEMSEDLITELSATGKVTYISAGVFDLLGYSVDEITAMPPFPLMHPDDRERVESQVLQAVATRAPIRLDHFRLRRRDGEWLTFETTGLIYTRADGEDRLLTVSRDITARQREEQQRRDLEEQVQRAQKLESLGILAGGVAHDFNNLLTPILGAASLGLEELPAGSPLREKLRKIQQAAERAAALTNQMLSYAGQGPLKVERLDLSALVEEMGELVRSTVSGRTVLDFDLATDLPSVTADAAQLGQVVVNLISNAVESLGDGERKVSVCTGVVEIGSIPSNALFAEDLAAGSHVYFEVVDTGSGMTAETSARIFDPFFTTKFAGRGLGLAAVAGIVRGHRGAIEIDSQAGSGTRFRVLLPIATRSESKQASGDSPVAEWRASGTVLVIDDEEGVRDFVGHVMSRAGLSVLEAADGTEGIELFRSHADEIRLVLLDRTMPHSDGGEILDQLRGIRSDVAIMLMSGYSEEHATAELSHELAGFLKKPFLPETLLEHVRKVLESA